MRVENFYGLEGLDAVGKTTVKEILNEHGFVMLKTPPDSFPLRRATYDQMRVNPRFAFYLMGVMMAGSEAKEETLKGNKVICDRYLLTTVAAHEAMGLSKVTLDVIKPILKSIPIPENTFLLIANEEVRIERLMARGANEVDINNMKINDKILAGYRAWSAELDHKLTEIDTSYIPAKQVAEQIEDLTYSK